jgi:hypothetical protein
VAALTRGAANNAMPATSEYRASRCAMCLMDVTFRELRYNGAGTS